MAYYRLKPRCSQARITLLRSILIIESLIGPIMSLTTSCCCSLAQLQCSHAVVDSLQCTDSSANRLKSLGIFAGQQIEIARRGNPLIVKAAGSRIAVSEGIAEQILVREFAA